MKTEIGYITRLNPIGLFSNHFLENLRNGTQQIDNGNSTTKPDIQLWGQTIQPLTFKTFEKHAMLGNRFFTHTAACFFNEPISQFIDRIIDFVDIGGAEAVLLYSQLRDVNSLTRRIELIEAFLMQRLFRFNHKFNKLKLVSEVMQDLRKDNFLEISAQSHPAMAYPPVTYKKYF